MNREIKIILAVFVYSFLFVTLAICQTNISGNVEGVWTKANSPYLVTEHLTVPSGDSLIIEPGVQIRFQGHYKFIVNGLLKAVGTETDSILFTRDQPIGEHEWWSIRFIDADDNSVIKYCIIEHANATRVVDFDDWGGGIFCLRSSPIISNNTIRNNSAYNSGAISCIDFNGEITENLIIRNTSLSSGEVLACTESSNPKITGNIIADNNGGGIWCSKLSGSALISENIIYNNSSGIRGHGPGNFEILNNEIYNNNGSGIHFYYGVGDVLVNISRNLIYNNNSTNEGGGISLDDAGGHIINNTIDRNGSVNKAGGIYIKTSRWAVVVQSNIVTNSSQGAGIFCEGSSTSHDVSYNDVWNNAGGDSIECSVASSGNISFDPLFVGGEPFNYHLQSNSPCIDSGHPTNPLDPDGTPPDMGAFYFDQSVKDTIPPNPPQNLAAQSGDKQIILTWSKNSEPDFLRYRIYGSTSPSPISRIDSTNSIDNTTKTIVGLSNGTKYYFRITAVDSSLNESGYSNEVNATPSAGTMPPTVTTNAASNVSTTTATLNGTVNPNSLSTTVKFEYGTTQSYGNEITAIQSPVSGSSAISVTAELTSLAPNTTYHYRIVATNSAGTTTGSNQAFTTSANAPAVTTNLAANVSATAATLNGSVNPNSLSATVKFEYGTSTSYGSEILARQSPVTGTNVVSVDAELTGLTPNTTYHYRVVAINSAGTTTGSNQSFTTSANAPTVMTEAATNVGETSCTLNGSVNPNGLSASVKFEYGPTSSYGSEVTAMQSPVSGLSSVNVSAQITDLLANTEYHYRVVATNSAPAPPRAVT